MAKVTRLASSDISGTNKIGYDFEIKSDAGTLTTLNPNHEIQLLPVGGLSFSYDSGDMFEPFDPIVSSRLDLTFFATHDEQLDDIVAMNRAGEKATYIKVRIWKNLSVEQYWYGVLIPEETVYEVTDGRTKVSLKFADGIKLLDAEEFSDASGNLITGWDTMLTYVNTILRKIPWVDEEFTGVDTLIRETPFFELKDWNDSVGYTFSSEGGMLRKVGFLAETYLKDKAKSSDGRLTRYMDSESCLKVLKDICINLGYKICWNGETFHFFSPLNYSDAMQGQASHDSITYLRDQSGNQTGTYDAFEPEWNADADTYLLNGATRVFSNCYKEAVVTHKANIGSNIVGPQSGRYIRATTNAGDQQVHATYSVPNYILDSGNSLTLRVAGTVQHNFETTTLNDIRRRVLPYATFQLKVGSYYLSAPAMSYVDTFDLGGYNFECPQHDLPEAFWTTTPSWIEIPYTTKFSYATPTADEHLDGANVIPLGVSHDGNGNYAYDNTREISQIEYTLVTPPIPANSTGIDLINTLGANTNSLSGANGEDNTASIQSMFTGANPELQFFQQRVFLYEGEQSDDPSYGTANSGDTFTETLDLGDVHIAARLNRSGNAGYLSYELEAGGYSFDSTFVVPNDTTTVEPNNLRWLVEEWYRLAGTGMEGLEGTFVFRVDTSQTFLPQADSVFSTGCILGNFQTADLLISSIRYDLSGGMEISSLVIDRDAGVSIADTDRPINDTGRPNPPTVDGRTVGAGGSTVSPTDLEDANQDNQILSIFLSRNNP